MSLEIMLDLETMGTGPDAAIIAIGAVAFDLDKGELLPYEFYHVVDLGSSVDEGGVIDASTVMWWLKQSDEARSAFYGPRDFHIRTSLDNFAAWCNSLCGVGRGCLAGVWGNGATFDNVILSQAYKRAVVERPWPYRADRCYRTIVALHPEIPFERVGVYHNALDDAKSQALHLIKILKKRGE